MQLVGTGRAPGVGLPPDGLISGELDRANGTLATAAIPPDRRYTEYFLEGTEAALRMDLWRFVKRGTLVF